MMNSLLLNGNAPTKEELDHAIGSLMKENQQPELAQIKQRLQQSNPTWHIPDRRLRKLLKHHQSDSSLSRTLSPQPSPPITLMADDVSQISTVSKKQQQQRHKLRLAGLSRKIFSRKLMSHGNNNNHNNNQSSLDGDGGGSGGTSGGPPLRQVEIETPPSGLRGLPPMEEEDYAPSPTIGLEKAIVTAAKIGTTMSNNAAEISLLDLSTSVGETTTTTTTMETTTMEAIQQEEDDDVAIAAYADENSSGKEKPCFACASCTIM